MQIEGWENTTFDKHIDCITGFAFKSSEYSNDPNNIKLLRGDNIEPNSLRWREAKYWSSDKLQNLDRYFLEEGDFVIALDRTWITNGLKVAEIKESDIPCLLVQRVARIRAKITLEQSLLRQYFSGHQFEQYVKSVQTATAVPHISPNDIKEFPLLLPPIQEQKKIAEILSTWDKAIETVEKLVANSQQQKKALMQQLLTGQKRLLDDNGVKFGDEWAKGELGDLANIDSGYAFKSSDISDDLNGIPIIRMSDLKSGKLDLINSAKVSLNTISGLQKFKLNTGDFVFGMSGSLTNFAWIREKDLPCYLNQRVGRLVANSQANQLFVTYLYLSDRVQQSISDKAAGAAQLNISVNDLRKTQVFYPTIKEQEKIAQVLTLADQEIDLYKEQLDKLKLEKKALMQQLLTGQKRVKLDT